MFGRIKKRAKLFYLTKIKKKSFEQIKIEEYRDAGIKIGDGCRVYSQLPTGRDCFLLSIGSNVTISFSVIILLHDASIGLATAGQYTDLLGEVNIGDNCFVGAGSIILPGVSLAKGTIVGAGSVVTKSIFEEGLIIAGNPASIIGTVDGFVAKNLGSFFNLNGLDASETRKLAESHKEMLIRRATIKRK